MDIKITRKVLIGKCGGVWCDHINSYLIHGRIVSDDEKYFKRFKFVANVNFSMDGWDEENQCDYTETEILESVIDGFLNLINGYDNCEDFYNLCNDSIVAWNHGCRV